MQGGLLVLVGRPPSAHGVGWTNSQEAKSELTQAVNLAVHPSNLNQQLPEGAVLDCGGVPSWGTSGADAGPKSLGLGHIL